jgi:hypothetical protein
VDEAAARWSARGADLVVVTDGAATTAGRYMRIVI